MGKGSKRQSWKQRRNTHNRIGRELQREADLALVLSAPTPTNVIAAVLPILARSAHRPVQPRPAREMTEREIAIREWYFHGKADDDPPDGLTETELNDMRRRAKQ